MTLRAVCHLVAFFAENPIQRDKPCPKRSCQTWYEVLGVPESATQTQIESAYQELVEGWHTDPPRDDDDIIAIFCENEIKWCNAAYAVLKDPVKRQLYDAELLRQRRPVIPSAANELCITCGSDYIQGLGCPECEMDLEAPEAAINTSRE